MFGFGLGSLTNCFFFSSSSLKLITADDSSISRSPIFNHLSLSHSLTSTGSSNPLEQINDLYQQALNAYTTGDYHSSLLFYTKALRSIYIAYSSSDVGGPGEGVQLRMKALLWRERSQCYYRMNHFHLALSDHAVFLDVVDLMASFNIDHRYGPSRTSGNTTKSSSVLLMTGGTQCVPRHLHYSEILYKADLHKLMGQYEDAKDMLMLAFLMVEEENQTEEIRQRLQQLTDEYESREVDAERERKEYLEGLAERGYYIRHKLTAEQEKSLESQIESNLESMGRPVLESKLVLDAIKLHPQLTGQINQLMTAYNRKYKGQIYIAPSKVDKAGYGIYAAKDYEQGELLYGEEPFVVGSVSENHCYMCLKPFAWSVTTFGYSYIVCEGCKQEYYCSDQCRTQAFETYHQFLCHPVLGKNLNDFRRFIGTVGASGSSRIHLLLHRLYGMVLCKAEHTKELVSPAELPEIVLLKQHVPLELDSLVPAYERMKTLLCLGSQELEPWMDMDSYSILGSLLSYSFSIYTAEQQEQEEVGMGAGLYCVSNFFNHSCEANVNWTVKVEKNGSQMMVYAAKQVKKDEELFITYIPRYASQKDRQRALEQYNFVCDCTQCNREKKETVEQKREHTVLQ